MISIVVRLSVLAAHLPERGSGLLLWNGWSFWINSCCNSRKSFKLPHRIVYVTTILDNKKMRIRIIYFHTAKLAT